MKANGLELKRIKSKTEVFHINNFDDVVNRFSANGYAVAYLDYKVLIGKILDRRFEFYNNEMIEEKYIQRLRLFNEHKEILIWRHNGVLKGRLRVDDEGYETFIVDAWQVLWGTKTDNFGNGWIRLYEDRGTELILPHHEGVRIDNKKNRLFIMTRNYISFHHKTNQATYVDCRFIKFTNKPLE